MLKSSSKNKSLMIYCKYNNVIEKAAGEADMKNFCILTDALAFIEDNLCEDITQEEIAASCYCSLSSLQKLFRFVFHMSLKEYISKRRLTNAARDLVSSDMTVTDIAMKYRYNSPEVFSRAFSRLWGTAPSSFSKKWKFTEIFPRIHFEYDGGSIMSIKKCDVSELYDVLREKKKNFILCFDIVGLMAINDNISYEAGDAAILECLSRINAEATDNMLMFRIGSDEFILVSDISDADGAMALAERILDGNGKTVHANGKDIPVSMRAVIMRFDDSSLRYSEFFSSIHDAINEAKLEENSRGGSFSRLHMTVR